MGCRYPNAGTNQMLRAVGPREERLTRHPLVRLAVLKNDATTAPDAVSPGQRPMWVRKPNGEDASSQGRLARQEVTGSSGLVILGMVVAILASMGLFVSSRRPGPPGRLQRQHCSRRDRRANAAPQDAVTLQIWTLGKRLLAECGSFLPDQSLAFLDARDRVLSCRFPLLLDHYLIGGRFFVRFDDVRGYYDHRFDFPAYRSCAEGTTGLNAAMNGGTAERLPRHAPAFSLRCTATRSPEPVSFPRLSALERPRSPPPRARAHPHSAKFGQSCCPAL